MYQYSPKLQLEYLDVLSVPAEWNGAEMVGGAELPVQHHLGPHLTRVLVNVQVQVCTQPQPRWRAYTHVCTIRVKRT